MAFEKQCVATLVRVFLLFSPAMALANESVAPVDSQPVPVAKAMQGLVDPTRPVAFVAPAGGLREGERKLQLQAIYVGEMRREAVINGRTVRVGDTLEQAKILAIGPGRVSYSKNGNEGELVLLPRVLQPVQGED
jgi:MSHA biogenesis protein MshK